MRKKFKKVLDKSRIRDYTKNMETQTTYLLPHKRHSNTHVTKSQEKNLGEQKNEKIQFEQHYEKGTFLDESIRNEPKRSVDKIMDDVKN